MRVLTTNKLLGKFYLLLLMMVFENISNSSAQRISYFSNPIDSPMFLSGNFCQLRDGHFHYGLDLPTNNTEGWPIRAAADGYISRIFVASYGYGNALFVTHPNGMTTVYTHLSRFSNMLDDYTLNQHYSRKQNSLDIFPKKKLLSVKKGDIIAYSGNTGGSSGPHLHFEIRNSGNELQNPQYYLSIPDTIAPTIGNIVSTGPGGINVLSESESQDTFVYSIADKILLAAEIYDRAIFTENKLAPRSFRLYQDNKKIYECTFNHFTFGQNKYVNKHIHYDYYWKNGIRLHKLYKESDNLCSFYNGDGSLYITPGRISEMRIEAEDFDHRISSKTFWIKMKTDACSAVSCFNEPLAMKSIGPIYTADSSAMLHGSINLNPGTQQFVSTSAGNAEVVGLSHEPFLHQPNLYIRIPEQFSARIHHKLFVQYYDDSKSTYMGGKLSDGWINASIAIPGKYRIYCDSVAPAIALDSMTSSYIAFHIKDTLSGIGYYSASVNGKYAHISFDAKSGLILYKKNKHTPEGMHELVITVADKKQNYNTWRGPIKF